MLTIGNVNTQRVFDIVKDTPATLGWGMSHFNGTLAQNVSVVADHVVQADLAMFLSQPYRAVDITPPVERLTPCEHIPGKNNTKNCRRVYYMPGGLELAATQEVKNIARTEILVAENQQGYILDFYEGPEAGTNWRFVKSECQVYGFPFGAFHLCLRNDGLNTLQAREYSMTWHQFQLRLIPMSKVLSTVQPLSPLSHNASLTKRGLRPPAGQLP